MARIKDKEKAIKLRNSGRTYSEIKETLKIPKSTLSSWLSKYPLSKKQLRNLEKNIKYKKVLAIEKTRITKFKKRRLRLEKTYHDERKKLVPLTDRELYLCGLFLYWGEGLKGLRNRISLNNTDPDVVKFYLFWLTKILKIPKSKLKVFIHLYKDMNINKSLNYWSKELQLPRSQFMKPYVKESTRKGLTQKGFGHGTCGIYISDVLLKEKILLGIDAIADSHTKKVRI